MTGLGQLLWQPGAGRVAASAIDQFRRRYAPDCADSASLHQWSVSNLAAFWDAAWEDCGLVGERGMSPSVERAMGDDIRSCGFFPDAKLSYAENLLAGGDRPGASEVAIIFRREDGVRRTLTWTQLRSQVSAAQGWLASVGVVAGDHVAAWLPNLPETVVVLLAVNGLGAVFTSTSPDFGVAGVLDRFSQVNPKVLVAADGYVYGGKRHDRLSPLAEIVDALPTLEAVAVVGELSPDPELPNLGEGSASLVPWARVVRNAEKAGAPTCWRMPFDQPGFVLYSSGTTGKPKPIVHSGAGVLIKQATEHQMHCDVRPGDRVFYFTTCGWMMWNWLVTMLAAGATIVLYDGSPFHPEATAMWDLAEQERVTLFGTSAKFIDACAKAGLTPATTHDLGSLRTITSTGSPLSAEGFEYVYTSIKSDVHLASISGGTDLCGCFVLGDPTRPVYAGEIQGPALGTAADVWDEAGRSLADRPGERGELVCTQPFPSMPLRFAGDADGSRYKAAYFERFPGVWAHGDFASWTAHCGIVIHGRSDATLNAGGVRIGTAEIYRQVEQIDGIAEALAIGQEWEGDTRIVLFVRLSAPEGRLTDELQAAIRSRLRAQCSPRHVPARIVAVTDLPRTRSGKLAELAVADVVHGRPVRNTEALANPEALALFAGLPDLLR
ncbi:MAG: acetoacetate--CoA ligase [Candidatus Nanopelagicales bacterium]|nr:acetoacetate--CoA ligase [Candidatus Nanopelagicales bacterium]MDZ4250523.1 acetoacetate--CoA ligase [Candidatus Nanopelagicales bacterium]